MYYEYIYEYINIYIYIHSAAWSCILVQEPFSSGKTWTERVQAHNNPANAPPTIDGEHIRSRISVCLNVP